MLSNPLVSLAKTRLAHSPPKQPVTASADSRLLYRLRRNQF